jgi:hypothetical protein
MTTTSPGPYQQVVAGLVAALRARVPALKSVLDYEPARVDATPMAYVLFDASSILPAGQLSARHFRPLVRVVVQWVDNEQAERQIAQFVDQVIAAVDADPFLGGAITSGYARVIEQQGVFVVINKTTYRALDCTIDALSKVPYGS